MWRLVRADVGEGWARKPQRLSMKRKPAAREGSWLFLVLGCLRLLRATGLGGQLCSVRSRSPSARVRTVSSTKPTLDAAATSIINDREAMGSSRFVHLLCATAQATTCPRHREGLGSPPSEQPLEYDHSHQQLNGCPGWRLRYPGRPSNRSLWYGQTPYGMVD